MKTIKNTFISHEGLVLKNFLLHPHCAFNLTGKKDNTFYLQFWKLTLEQYIVSTYGKSLTKKTLKDTTYLHIYTKWFGYFFWLTDSLPKLIKTKAIHKNVKLIYPENWKSISYVNEVLDMFPDLDKEIIPKGVHIQVKKLCLPKTRKWSGYIPKDDIDLIKHFIVQLIEKNSNKSKFGKRIYISREKAQRRKPINESELNEVLENFGFDRICLEDFSILEQLTIIYNAEIVIGLHGAGLANCLMMQEGRKLIELAPQVRTEKELRTSFKQLAETCKLNYEVIFNPIELKNEQDIYDNNITVNLKKLEELLNQEQQ